MSMFSPRERIKCSLCDQMFYVDDININVRKAKHELWHSEATGTFRHNKNAKHRRWTTKGNVIWESVTD